jgi:hypothetical protein
MNGRIAYTCLALALVSVCSGGTGCALPVIEGIFDQRDFALFDDTPEARGESDDATLLVFVDIDDGAGRLRTVSIDLRALPTLPVGEAIDVGSGKWDDARPSVEVVEGSLVTEQLADGGTLMSTGDDARRAVSQTGTMTLAENGDTVVGSFDVDLDDGGFLHGSFRSTR